jgi:hypothetical protein
MAESKKQRSKSNAKTLKPTPIAPAAEPKRISDEGPVTGPRKLTDLQSIICDLAGDLIIRGGQPEDVDQLLTAVSRHSSRRMFPTIEPSDPNRVPESVASLRECLAKLWPQVDDATLEPPDSIGKTLSEQMRADLRSQLAYKFNEFVWNARWHELHLMDDVLNEFVSCSAGPINDDAECFLARAFMNQIGQGETTYVKVPEKHIKLIEEYVALLNRAEQEAA